VTDIQQIFKETHVFCKILLFSCEKLAVTIIKTQNYDTGKCEEHRKD